MFPRVDRDNLDEDIVQRRMRDASKRFTSLYTGIVEENDLVDQVPRCSIDDAHQCSQQRRISFVVENDDDRRIRQLIIERRMSFAAASKRNIEGLLSWTEEEASYWSLRMSGMARFNAILSLTAMSNMFSEKRRFDSS